MEANNKDGLVKTLHPQQFLTQLSLMNVSDEFSNTCKVLLNNTVLNQNIQKDITNALIGVMIFNGHDILKLSKKFLDSIDFANYELWSTPIKDDKGNDDGFAVEVEKVNHKGKSDIIS